VSKTYDVAVVGATGAVGEAIFSILEERNFPVGKIYALASSRSVGKRIKFNDGSVKVQDLSEFDFSKVSIGLFSAGASISKEYAPKAASAGCVVIDNTSEFRYDDDIPLVIPEVNPEKISEFKARGIIANPNCSTIQMLVALKPIYDEVGIERINVCTYQAVSGTGKQAIEEVVSQTVKLLNGKPITSKIYPKQIAFNVLPQIDVFMDNGYTKEEMKMVWETKKIFSDQNILVNATAVRVPVFYGHSEAIHLETKEKIEVEVIHKLMNKAPGVTLLDERIDGGYPTAVTESSGNDAVFVGRVRKDISHPRGIDLWVVSDNVRKGAALNSVQIAEELVKKFI
jgi:aspartate-semialdehyde dehydrogenase